MIERWSQQLRRRFFSNRVVLQTGRGVRLLDIPDQGGVWIVGRDCCAFRSVDLRTVPPGKIEAVVKTQVHAVSPFSTPGFWYVVQDGVAKVWVWDEARRLQATSELDFSVDDFLVIPESCFTRPSGNLSLWEGLGEGCFAQLWDEDKLLADTWWSGRPNAVDWRTFLRGVGQPASDLPEPETPGSHSLKAWVPIRSNPWASRSLEKLVWQVSVLVFALLLGFQSTGSVRLYLAERQLETEIREMSQAHLATIQVRDKAYDLRDKARQFRLLMQPDQVQLMNHIVAALPASAGGLMVWQYEESTLEFVVADTAPDLEAYVLALQTLPDLSQVSVEPLDRAGQIKIRASVVQ